MSEKRKVLTFLLLFYVAWSIGLYFVWNWVNQLPTLIQPIPIGQILFPIGAFGFFVVWVNSQKVSGG